MKDKSGSKSRGFDNAATFVIDFANARRAGAVIYFQA
jgi:hypothetical protein